MNKAILPVEFQMLKEHFSAKKRKQSELWDSYEKSKNYGMAYLALWAVLEDFSVHLGPFCQRLQLKVELHEWLVHLEDRGSKPPAKIGTGKFEISKKKTATIPVESQLQLVLPLGAAPQFYAVLGSKNKFRERRNAIAHSGDIVSARVYDDFKAVALAAIAGVDAWLSLNAILIKADV